jgi:hypothetical protein
MISESKHYYKFKTNILINKKCETLKKTCWHHVNIDGVFTKMSKKEIRSLAKKRKIRLNEHFDIVKLNVSSVCLQSFPCQHQVSVKESSFRLLNGKQIKQLYIRFKMEVPDHFKSY